MNKIIKLSAVGLLTLGLAACQKSNFEMTAVEGPSTKDDNGKKSLQCEVDPVDYNIRTRVFSFELIDNTQVSFGFNLVQFLNPLGLNIKLKRGILDLEMIVTDPLNESVPLADVSGKGTFRAGGFGVDVNLGQIAMGANFFAQTPLAKLTQSGLEDGFEKVISSLASGMDWQTKVSKVVDEKNLILSVGVNAGIRLGDQFQIYNVENIWEGTPCQSPLLISRKLSDVPLAVAEAIQVDQHAAVLRIRSRTSSERIEPGALVEIKELKKANSKEERSLLKSMRIVSIDSKPLVINNVNVNVADYMKRQLGPIIMKKGFYLHE